jgi:hypothetical protein
MAATDLMWALPGLKAARKLLGLPENKISAHLFRYRGASTLGMAGYPEYIIAVFGAWAFNSKAMRVYIRPSNAISVAVSHRMTSEKSASNVTEVVNLLLKQRIVIPPEDAESTASQEATVSLET